MRDTETTVGVRPLRALTVQQPWASAIASGCKPVENRTWSPVRWGLRAGEWFAVHASGRLPTDAHTVYAQLRAEGLLSRSRIALPADARGLPLGAVVAVVRLVDAQPTTSANRATPWHAVGQIGWELADAWALPRPVEVTGALGVWKLPDDVAREVRAQWAASRVVVPPPSVHLGACP